MTIFENQGISFRSFVTWHLTPYNWTKTLKMTTQTYKIVFTAYRKHWLLTNFIQKKNLKQANPSTESHVPHTSPHLSPPQHRNIAFSTPEASSDTRRAYITHFYHGLRLQWRLACLLLICPQAKQSTCRNKASRSCLSPESFRLYIVRLVTDGGRLWGGSCAVTIGYYF